MSEKSSMAGWTGFAGLVMLILTARWSESKGDLV